MPQSSEDIPESVRILKTIYGQPTDRKPRSRAIYKDPNKKALADRLLEDQAYACAICKATEELLNLDHSHYSGKARGLLCRRCNIGIGWFKDNFTILQKAVDYLKKYKD